MLKAIREALSEDLGNHGDITTMATIPPTTTATATFLAKVGNRFFYIVRRIIFSFTGNGAARTGDRHTCRDRSCRDSFSSSGSSAKGGMDKERWHDYQQGCKPTVKL